MTETAMDREDGFDGCCDDTLGEKKGNGDDYDDNKERRNSRGFKEGDEGWYGLDMAWSDKDGGKKDNEDRDGNCGKDYGEEASNIGAASLMGGEGVSVNGKETTSGLS